MARPSTRNLTTANAKNFQSISWRITIRRTNIENPNGGTLVMDVHLPYPPERETRNYPQRSVVTPTVGGSAKWDFGMDNPKITLEGNTGAPNRLYVTNALAQFFEETADGTPGGNNNISVLNGSEIYDFLKNNLARWRERAGINDNLEKSNQFVMTLEDRYNNERYTVNMGQIDFTREKERALWFKYRIPFTVLGIQTSGQSIEVKKKENRLNSFVRKINKAADFLEGAGDDSKQFISRNLSGAKGFLNSVNNIFVSTNSIVSAVRQSARDAASPADFFLKVGRSALSLVRNANTETKQVIEDYKELADDFKDFFYIELRNVQFNLEQMEYVYRKIPKETDVEIPDISQGEGTGMGSQKSPAPFEIEETTDRITVRTQNLSQAILYTVKQSDTLEGIAFRFYGDINKWFDIAQVNKVSKTDLKPGTVLTLPDLNTSLSGIDVVTADRLDRLGADIDARGGDFNITPGGDFGVIRGRINTIESIARRITTAKGIIFRHPEYGLEPDLKGLPSVVAFSIISSRIEDEVRQDPRVISAVILDLALDRSKIQGELKVTLPGEESPVLIDFEA